jgi:hypothetical protein
MTDYSNQNITGTNLTGVNLTGANFTNTNATNVNFTNATITNAIFKNTLITGATLTGITFSNLQKAQLLLRAANISITAINNLTSLTIPELRSIQPAISLRSLNKILSITVAIPVITGSVYSVSVTPVINQVVCIFVAVNQKVTLLTSGNVIRTILNNGTVIQDYDNSNATISYLKIGGVSYRVSNGNADGVIALIPLDLNTYQINDGGINDVISLNTGSVLRTSIGYSWDYILNNNSTRAAKVNFGSLNINLLTARVRGVIHIKLGPGDFTYPNLIFNNNHTYPSVANTTSDISRTINIIHNSTWSNQHLYNVAQAVTNQFNIYQDSSMTFANIAFPNIASMMTIRFDIDLQKHKDNTCRQTICSGDWTWTSKNVNLPASYVYHGYFQRLTDISVPRITEITPTISNLVALYNFDSNATDSSTNSNNLTNVNSVTYNTTEYMRGAGAASFNGSNYFERVNDGRFSPDNFTVAFWVKPANSAGGLQSVVSCRDGFTIKGWMIYINGSNNLEFVTGAGGVWSYGSDDIYSGIGTINTWVHIAFTVTKSTNSVVAYINGNVKLTFTRTYINNPAYTLRIGGGGDGGTADLLVKNGTLIDDFRFYNKVLSASEVSSIVSPVNNLVSWYNFDSNANDSTINGNTLTNFGSVTYNTSDYKIGTAAASFNGTTAYFERVNDGRFSPDNFTISFWIKPVNSSGNYQAIAACRNNTVPNLAGWIIYISPSNSLEFWTGGGSTYYGADLSLFSGFGTVNTWVHVAFTFTKSTSLLVVYINGNLTTAVTRTYTNNTINNMRIGAGSNEGAAGFFLRNGTLMDDFRFYNKALATSEIYEVYHRGAMHMNKIPLNDIGICSFLNGTPTIEHVTMNLEVINLPTFT